MVNPTRAIRYQTTCVAIAEQQSGRESGMLSAPNPWLALRARPHGDESVTRQPLPPSLDSAHVTRKRFGQHFLRDEQIISRIVQAINPLPGQRIVEIGPGEGAITLPILRKAGRMTVIELDRDLVPRIASKCAGVGEVEVINADVLGVDLGALAGSDKLRVVGNLPYNISSPILFHCIDHLDAIADMHFMLQKEVVERMAAAPGSKVYGRLSVMLQLACRVEPLLAVPPEAFRPPPKVDSAIVSPEPCRAKSARSCTCLRSRAWSAPRSASAGKRCQTRWMGWPVPRTC